MNQPFHSEVEVTENNTPPCPSLWPPQQRLRQDQGGTIYPSHPSIPQPAFLSTDPKLNQQPLTSS